MKYGFYEKLCYAQYEVTRSIEGKCKELQNENKKVVSINVIPDFSFSIIENNIIFGEKINMDATYRVHIVYIENEMNESVNDFTPIDNDNLSNTHGYYNSSK